MHWFGLILTGGLCGVFLVFAAMFPFTMRKRSRRARIIAPIASILFAIGAIGFFGSGFSACGGLNVLPQSFEWPAGYTDGIIAMPGGLHVVPLISSGRVQIYDANWHFIRGWAVDAAAGTFQLIPSGRAQFDVITARQNKLYTYRIDGTLIQSRTYARGDYGSFKTATESRVVPTRIWLWPFSSPIFGWLSFMLGMLAMGLVRRKTTHIDR
jgi:hypothetical protein